MLICEELFLLLTTDAGGTEGWNTQKAWALSGAVIADLIVAERVAVVPDKKDPRLELVDAAPTGSPILDAAVQRLGERSGKRFSAWVKDRRLNPEPEIVESLAAAGVVRVEEKRLLGVVPAKYPALDARPERELRQRLQRVIGGALAPTAADVTELTILKSLKLAHRVLRQESAPLRGRELNRRIDELATQVPGQAAGVAVAKALADLNAAIAAATISVVVASQ